MKTVRLVVALIAQVQLAVCAEEPWRFIQLADWHAAEVYVQPERYPGVVSRIWPTSGCSIRTTAAN